MAEWQKKAANNEKSQCINCSFVGRTAAGSSLGMALGTENSLSKHSKRARQHINTYMKSKYNQTKFCKHCGNEFITRPRFVDYCSTSCKNPNNRAGSVPWNKGIKLTDEQKAKINMSGLTKGWGWNKGKPNIAQSNRWTVNNPNKDGRINNMRPKCYVDDEFTAYKRECKKATYRSRYAMIKEGTIPANVGKRKDQYQLDHIIPFRQGFELGISPQVIGGRQNLQWILGAENRKKWDYFQPESIVKNILGE